MTIRLHTQEAFCNAIENMLCEDEDLELIDAIITYCDREGIEMESVKKLLNPKLLKLLEEEAARLHCLK